VVVVGRPLDELLACWLADTAPEHAIRFKIVAAELLGLPAAEDLFSGERVVDDGIWLNRIGAPMTAAEVALDLHDAPAGSYQTSGRSVRSKS